VLALRHLSAAGINNRLCRIYRNCSSNFFSFLKEKVRPKEKDSIRGIFSAAGKSFRPPFSKGGGFQRQRLWIPFAEGK